MSFHLGCGSASDLISWQGVLSTWSFLLWWFLFQETNMGVLLSAKNICFSHVFRDQETNHRVSLWAYWTHCGNDFARSPFIAWPLDAPTLNTCSWWHFDPPYICQLRSCTQKPWKSWIFRQCTIALRNGFGGRVR